MTYKNSGRKRYLLWNLRDALEILNGQKEFQGEVWWTTDFHKDFSIYFSTGHSWHAFGESNTERKKKAIQQHHMISTKNTRTIPGLQIALVTDVENALQQKYFQDGMKLCLQKPIQKDHQAVMRNSTKLLIHNGLERMEKWKKLLNLWLKKHFIESGKKL